MTARVYAAITAVTAALARIGIAKHGSNLEDGYDYRRIDDLYQQLSPLLAVHKLCILPRVLERAQSDRPGLAGEVLVSVTVRAAFDLVSARDGSCHTIESFGEALDAGDKATAKAMTAAYKHAIIQAFCIPVNGHDQAEAGLPRLGQLPRATEPVEGWNQWSEDIAALVALCMSREAIERVQRSQRGELQALARERPELYARLGETIAARRGELNGATFAPMGHADASAAVKPQNLAAIETRELQDDVSPATAGSNEARGSDPLLSAELSGSNAAAQRAATGAAHPPARTPAARQRKAARERQVAHG